MVPVPEKPERSPPATETSPEPKSVDGSLSVKVMVAVSPVFNALLFEDMVMVGAIVSTPIVNWDAARLLFPAESVNVTEATSKVAVVLLLEDGVKVAV